MSKISDDIMSALVSEYEKRGYAEPIVMANGTFAYLSAYTNFRRLQIDNMAEEAERLVNAYIDEWVKDIAL